MQQQKKMKSNFVLATIFAFMVCCVHGSIPTPDCDFLCPQIYLPVCGSDGKTYGNACELRRADCKSPGKIYIVHRGPCYCLLPKVVGPCRARIPRYFYNQKTGQCELFYYGGCRGNKNNFETKNACEATCKRGLY